jgi:integrase
MNAAAPTAEMPLGDFFSNHYDGCARKRAIKQSRRKNFEMCVDDLRSLLGRAPIVEDLNVGVRARLAAIQPACRVSAFNALWAVAAAINLVKPRPEAKPPSGNRQKRRSPLSEEPGTLWEICVRDYFPNRLRIGTKTVKEYEVAVRDLQKFLCRTPTLDDLTDETIQRFMRWGISRQLAAKTVNERRSRLCALWNWLARRGHMATFPTVEKLPEPESVPHAWNRAEMAKLFAACRGQRGFIACVPASLWWLGLHAIAWNCGERIGAILALRWEWVDYEAAILRVPAKVRKGGRKPATYRLWDETISLLRQLEQPSRDLLFPWPYHETTLYSRHKRMREEAGLSTDRKSAFHRMRVSHASWLDAGGGDATRALLHDSSATTQKHYLDPAVCEKPAPKLFWPTDDATIVASGVATELPTDAFAWM